jgi:hypothetical protein
MDVDSEGLNDIVKAQRGKIEHSFLQQIDVLSGVAKQFDLKKVAQSLRNQSNRLDAERFELMVAGRFKVGKSTFLNALLASGGRVVGLGGASGVLPVDDLPCTAVLTRIEYADTPFVRAVFFDGAREDWSFERYVEVARLWGEATLTEDGPNKTILARVKSFVVTCARQEFRRRSAGRAAQEWTGTGRFPRHQRGSAAHPHRPRGAGRCPCWGRHAPQQHAWGRGRDRFRA